MLKKAVTQIEGKLWLICALINYSSHSVFYHEISLQNYTLSVWPVYIQTPAKRNESKVLASAGESPISVGVRTFFAGD
jgi:hypothetical protein